MDSTVTLSSWLLFMAVSLGTGWSLCYRLLGLWLPQGRCLGLGLSFLPALPKTSQGWCRVALTLQVLPALPHTQHPLIGRQPGQCREGRCVTSRYQGPAYQVLNFQWPGSILPKGNIKQADGVGKAIAPGISYKMSVMPTLWSGPIVLNLPVPQGGSGRRGWWCTA